MNRSPETGAEAANGRRIKGAAIVAALLLAVMITWQLSAQSQPASPSGELSAVPTAAVESGPIEKVLRITGSTSSINSYDVTAPRMERRGFGLTLTELIESGTVVERGTVLARLDPEQIDQQIDNVRTNMTNGEATLARKLAERDVALMNLRQDLKIAEANVENWKLESSAAEVLPDVEQEIVRLALEEAQASYDATLSDSKIQEEIEAIDIREQELSNQEYVRDLDRYTADRERYTIRAPIGGLVVRQQIVRNGEMALVQQGDEVNPGLPFLVIMDMSNMQVEARTNQVESRRVRIGQEARIGLDAFPSLEFRGEVTGVGALAQSGSTSNDWVRTIPVYVKIDGSSPNLLPDLSAHVDIILDREENAIKVPLEAVFEEEGQSYIYVRQGDGFDKRAVTIGMTNNTHAAVTSGLNAGEQVALQRPPDA